MHVEIGCERKMNEAEELKERKGKEREKRKGRRRKHG